MVKIIILITVILVQSFAFTIYQSTSENVFNGGFMLSSNQTCPAGNRGLGTFANCNEPNKAVCYPNCATYKYTSSTRYGKYNCGATNSGNINITTYSLVTTNCPACPAGTIGIYPNCYCAIDSTVSFTGSKTCTNNSNTITWTCPSGVGKWSRVRAKMPGIYVVYRGQTYNCGSDGSGCPDYILNNGEPYYIAGSCSEISSCTSLAGDPTELSIKIECSKPVSSSSSAGISSASEPPWDNPNMGGNNGGGNSPAPTYPNSSDSQERRDTITQKNDSANVQAILDAIGENTKNQNEIGIDNHHQNIEIIDELKNQTENGEAQTGILTNIFGLLNNVLSAIKNDTNSLEIPDTTMAPSYGIDANNQIEQLTDSLNKQQKSLKDNDTILSRDIYDSIGGDMRRYIIDTAQGQIANLHDSIYGGLIGGLNIQSIGTQNSCPSLLTRTYTIELGIVSVNSQLFKTPCDPIIFGKSAWELARLALRFTIAFTCMMLLYTTCTKLGGDE